MPDGIVAIVSLVVIGSCNRCSSFDRYFLFDLCDRFYIVNGLFHFTPRPGAPENRLNILRLQRIHFYEYTNFAARDKGDSTLSKYADKAFVAI